MISHSLVPRYAVVSFPDLLQRMRNLEATSCVVVPADILLSGAHCFCLDCDRGSVWVATSAGLCCISPPGNKVSLAFPLVEGGHVTSKDRVVGMEYVSDLDSVSLAMRNGDILLCNVTTQEVECMGSVSVGLLCMSWSPEQDVVVFTTGEENLLLMTREFDPITETSIHPEEFGEAKLVTVGWGKKETQFRGSLGKSTTEKPLQPALSPDDNKPRVSWRGDGEYFVCSAVDPNTGTRRLRVWTRDCVLHSTSESVEGLEQALHWRPSGNLIASTQRKPQQHDVIFYERNGLRHGQFTLPCDRLAVQVRELQWNSDSSVLALWLEELNSEPSKPTRTFVQLWYMNNYHWYLKQELHLPSSNGHTPSLTSLFWDPIASLKLHLLTEDGQYLCYNWRWMVAEGRAHVAENMTNVAVIDGTQILLTSFRHAVVPPPMCSHELSLPFPVLQVTFAPPPRCNDLLVLLTNGQAAVFRHEEGTTNKPELVAVTKILLGVDSFCLHSLRQLVWWQPDRLLGVAAGQEEAIVELSISTKGSLEIAKCRSVPSPGPVWSLCSNPDTLTAVVQLCDGRILRYSAEGDLLPWKLSTGLELRFVGDQPCEHISLAVLGGKERIIGLNSFRRLLYVDGEKLASGCTSFTVHDEFLVLTTDAHTCRFVPLSSDPQELTPLSSDAPHPLDESVRRVERGSKIVAAVTHDVKLILQMPRGNLETICPRALVLSSVRKRLDQLKFREAFLAMRKHRINLNFIYDHNPQAFLSHMKEFVQQLESVTFINLFLTELNKEDVTQTMYPGVRGAGERMASAGERMASAGERVASAGERIASAGVRGGGTSKVDCVCDAMRKALVELGENKYFLSVLTTHVKKTTPELELVLGKIQQLKDHPVEVKCAGLDQPVTVEEALKYALFLVDVNELFDVALGMYDFNLVLLVAEKSQKDPKEYLPFLNELRRLPLHYQRYRIDHYLGRYKKALVHISQCGPEKFVECLSLIQEQRLYAEALEIYTDTSSQEYKTIAKAYGDHLLGKGKHREAGLIFTQCDCLPEAMAGYEKAGCWQLVFTTSARLKQSAGERVELAQKIARSLKAHRHYSAAATVLLDYSQDIEEALVTLIEGNVWEEAMRIAYLHGRSDLIETHLKPGLLEAHQSQMTLMETLHSTFIKHSSRLAVVRETKIKKQTAISEGTYAADEKEADLFSDTSSITAISSVNSTIASKTSGRSSKNRRKAERKRHSLREGSTHEDVALLEALGDVVSSVDKMTDETSSLLGMLVQYGFTREARQVQKNFSDLFEVIRTRTPSIWQPQQPVTMDTHSLQFTGPGATVNSIIAAMATSNPPAPQYGTVPPPKLRENVQWKLDILS